MKSARNLPANRESELRDALALIDAGYSALLMRDGVTTAEATCYQRQRDFLNGAAQDRYKGFRA